MTILETCLQDPQRAIGSERSKLRRVSCRHLTISLIFATSLVTGIVETTNAQRSDSVRVVQYRPGLRIEDELRQEDSVVLIVDNALTTTLPTDIGYGKALEDAAVRSSLVVDAEVRKWNGTLSERGSWVSTHVTFAVRQVLRSSEGSVKRGDVLEMWASGGEVTIRNVLVRADPVPRFQTGRRYLMFLTEHPESQMLITVYSPLLVERGRTASILKLEDRDVTNLRLNGRSVTDLIRRIRQMPR
jgi:hypothetical protein